MAFRAWFKAHVKLANTYMSPCQEIIKYARRAKERRTRITYNPALLRVATVRVTPPSFKKRDETASALDYELAQERAEALGRSGRNLESALAALRAFDREHATDARDTRQTNDRNSLASAAGVALWSFVVQRESLGLRDSAAVMRAYAVPADVQARMGAFPVDPT